MGTKRLRIFAGPNGSGKSVLYNYLLSHQFFHQYFYINADEIAKGLAAGYSFANWPVAVCGSDFFYRKGLRKKMQAICSIKTLTSRVSANAQELSLPKSS